MRESRSPESGIRRRGRPGFTLIVVILVLAFLLSVGVALLSVTGTGPRIADNVRYQEQALNAAEAGFDKAWESVENSFSFGQWSSFDSHYLKEPSGIDLPLASNYFRKMTDEEIFALLDADGDGQADSETVLFFKQPLLTTGADEGPALSYTVFLIDDEAGGGATDVTDVLMVVIGTAGSGPSLTTSRLEIVLQVEAAT